MLGSSQDLNMVANVGKSVIRWTLRRAKALSDGPSRCFGPNRCSRRARRLGRERCALKREEARKSGEEAISGASRRPRYGARAVSRDQSGAGR
jgi:hypothetical protein